MTVRRLIRHASCAVHRKYKLTCEQFDRLREEADGRCQICRAPETESAHGVLSIDHDKDLGFWAVRGLLCTTCNGLLGRPGLLVGPEVDRYLAHPWHVIAGLKDPYPFLPVITVEATDPVAAVASVKAAAERYRLVRMNVSRRDRTVGRAEWEALKHAVRVAAASGVRQRDIVRATDHLLTREQVYEACHIRGRRIA